MANHAKVITGKTLDPNEVNEIVQKINKEKLAGVFTIKFESNVPNGWGKHQWFLQYKNEDYITLVFWLSDDVKYGYEENGEWIDSGDKNIVSEQSCIEFRHGHSFNFMWWVEGVIRENLGKHYNAKMYDDGVGDCGQANPERYETFKTYATKEDGCSEDELKKWKEFHFNWQKEAIPAELIEKLNLDFELTV